MWFIGNLSEMFKETITNVSLEMLQSELTICKELLELEPDNKCEREREKRVGKRERESYKEYKTTIFIYFRVRFDYSSVIRSC